MLPLKKWKYLPVGGEALPPLALSVPPAALCVSSSSLGTLGQKICWFRLFFFNLSSLLKSPEQRRCSGMCHPSKVVVLSLAFWRGLSCLVIKSQDYGAAVFPHRTEGSKAGLVKTAGGSGVCLIPNNLK